MTHGPPGQDWTLVLQRTSPPRQQQAGRRLHRPRMSSSAAIAVTIPTWITSGSPRSSSGSRGPYPIAAGVEAYERHAATQTRRPMVEPASR